MPVVSQGDVYALLDSTETVPGPEGAEAKVVVYIKLTHKPKN